MTTITQAITPLSDPPSTTDIANFETRADAFLEDMQGFAVELETFRGQANTVAGEVNTNASTATTKAAEALSSANSASTSASTATTQAGNASASASTATTQASAASASAAAAAADALAVAEALESASVPAAASQAEAEAGTEAALRAFSPLRISQAIQALGRNFLFRVARTSNTILAAADRGKWIDVTSGTFSQTFTAAATLGDGWTVTYTNSGTGAVTLDPNGSELIDGATTKVLAAGQAAIISCSGSAFTTLELHAGVHSVHLTTGNGYGSTNTKIRRYTTTQENVGTALTYADSATLGASITVNVTGLYEISMKDYHSSGSANIGASKNSAQLTTDVQSITAADRLLIGLISTGTAPLQTRTVWLTAGDVVRPHMGGSLPDTSTDVRSSFSIRKVG